MFYSKTTGGFYDTAIHGDAIPADAVEITAEQHAALLDAQASGKLIQADKSGKPVAVAPPPPTDAELAARIRSERDSLIAKTDWTQASDSPLPADAKAAYVTYRQALRDVTKQATFPQSVTWPVAP